MDLTRRLLCASVAVSLATGPTAARDEIDMEQIRIPHTRVVLPNGLTLLVHEDHSVPIVAVNLWYHVGSRNERRGRTGFAHLFEHFFFNGSEHHPRGFREAMDDLGANNRNGTTNTDRTNFFEDVPVSALERALYLEADRMGFLAAVLSQEMLERERGVVQNEKRQGENQPYGRVFDRIFEAIYPHSHPYSWPTIGLMEDLQAATIEDVRQWYLSYYGPNNCVLSLAGDVTYDKAVELVTRYFGSIPPGPPLSRLQAWVPRLDADVRETMEDRVPQARIYRVYHAPPWADPEMTELRLAAGVLAGSKSARLERRLIYEKELATGVTASVLRREIAGNFLVGVTVKPGVDPAEAEREMEAVLSRYLQEGPAADELSRARTRILADFIRGMERLGGFGGRSDILAESMTYGGDPEAYLAPFKMMAVAGPERVAEVSRKWLQAHHYTMHVTPHADLKAEPAGVDRSVLPALAEPPDAGFPRLQTRELANGLKLMLLERRGAPIVNMTLAVDAGFAADSAGRAGTATLALGLLSEGTRTRDAFQIADALDALGASIVTDSSLDQSLVRLRALKMNLVGSLELFSDVVLNPAFPEGMVQLAKRRHLARIGQEKAQPTDAALRVAPLLLYGPDHAYSAPLSGSGFEETVARIGREDLSAWHKAWFLPNNATLIVAGDVAMGELTSAIERAFGGWRGGGMPRKNIAGAAGPSGRRIYLIDKPDAPQSVIVAAHVSERGTSPDDLAVETVMQLFGGMATSRLNRNLRLDKHWSYGAFAILAGVRGPRPFAVIAPVQTDKTKESMVEVAEEIRGIAAARPVRGEEFESIKRNMVSRLAGRFETLASLEGAAQSIVSLGRPPEYYYEYARNVRALREADLAAAAARFIKPDQLIWIVVGDLEKIEPGIRELGWGEIAHLDADGRPVGR